MRLGHLFRSTIQAIILIAAATGLTAASSSRSAPVGSALQGRFSFQSYGIQEGLGNLSVLCLFQDRIGFIWVGTEDGLYRYDGQSFQVYGVNDGLPSSYVTDVIEDTQGRLWVATYSGLAMKEGDRFVKVGAKEGLPSGPVEDLSLDPHGRVLLILPQGPFQQGDASKTFAMLPGWSGGQATAVGAAKGGPRIWVAGFDGRNASIKSLQGEKWTKWEGSKGFGTERIDAVVPDGKGTVWARDAHHLWVLHPNAPRFELMAFNPPPISARGILHFNDGDLYVPTDYGLWVLSEGQWTAYNLATGLASDRVRDAIRDQEGSIWVGSLGIHRLLGRGLWRAYTTQDNLPDSVIWTIFHSMAGGLYVGTDKGLAKAGVKGWEPIPALAGVVIRTGVEATDGTFYLGTLPAKVLHWDPRSGRLLGSYDTSSGLGGKRLFRLVIDGDDHLWGTTEDSGLYEADLKVKPLLFKRVIPPLGTPREYFNGLCLGKSGRLYASGEKGLAVLDHGKWRRYTKADGLKGDFVAYSIEREDGSVVIGYFESAGLSVMTADKDGHLLMAPSGSLGDMVAKEKVYMIGEDRKGRTWVGTGRGVFVGKGNDIQHFGLADGLVSEDIDNMAFLSDPDGDVWIGTSGGLARFDAKAYQGSPTPPTSVFLSCAFGKQTIDLGGAPPKVPYAQNTLLARFAGLSFLGGSKVNHDVRLRGLESEWHGTDTQEARYPALGPGAYVLEVRSRIAKGAWGPTATFSFTIAPAWWQTWWFRGLLLLMGGLVITGIIQWRLTALKHHNLELEALVHARTEQLESANEALQAQSVTDSLTGLKNRRYLTACMPEDVARVRRVHKELKGERRDRAHVNVDLVLIMVDLDHFKEVNDTYGHAAGDLVLQQVADILRGCIRDMDTVVRWGGEEFLVVARNAARSEAVVVVERIRSRMEAHAFDLGDGTTLHRTCSIGFGYMPFLCSEPEFMDWEEVVDVADHCLYVAKNSGRNMWVGITTDLETQSGQMGERIPKRLAELVESAQVKVLTSRPNLSELNWD